ncbi:hypothetical protein [Lysinibacillus sphaericus]|uniref:hypothetical protein n=1 Tax=Lysinibacillus sphaericus TaxID=1421 RepID=UPI000C17D983|nr:hypothetical protein [Lysinibacillus sphaericus]PIJ98152.1 hypothetical protein CTN02_10445 [Lysinibacillus sphaericus]
MFKFNFRKEEKNLPLPVKETLEDLERDMIQMYVQSYSYITQLSKVKFISGVNTLLTFAIWFILLDFFRYYNGASGDSSPLFNFYKIVPVPNENLYIFIVLGFITTYLTVFFLGSANTYLFERIRVERHIANKSIDTYLKKHKGSLKSLLFGLLAFLTFYLLILEDMKFHQLILRDTIVYIFMLVTIFIYRYNKLVLKFSNHMKNQVLNTYLEAIESLLEESKNEKEE